MEPLANSLFKAIKKGQNSELTRLLKQDAYKNQVNATVGKKKNPLLLIAAKKGSKQIVENLLTNGADPLAKNTDKTTALMIAAERGYYSIIESILDHITDKDVKKTYINEQNTDGSTALFLAVDSDPDNLTAIVKLLVANGADSSIANNDGYTPAQLATDCEMASVANAMTVKEN
jgi:ankyrin repeat protein